MENAKSKIISSLKEIYSENELNSIVRLLLSKISGLNYTQLILSKNTIFSEKQKIELDFYLEGLKKNEPIQYVLGETEFYGLPFNVNSGVLIPRPETEELVEWVLKDSNGQKLNILDVGTGSACIAVALKHNLPKSLVIALDFSDKALEVATDNAMLNEVEIEFYQEDALHLNQEFISHFANKLDVIVSNPPYIPRSELDKIHENVKNYEPHSALFVPDNDPLLFYRKIAEAGTILLKKGGRIFFEIHRDFGVECVQLLENMAYTQVELRKDIFGNNRMISCIKPF